MLGQLRDMEKLTPGDSSYFEYGPNHYRGSSAQSVLNVDGSTTKLGDTRLQRLGDFLADEFLIFKIGVEGMYVNFDSEPHELHFPAPTVEIARVQTELGHGLRVKVTGFTMVPFKRE